MRRMSEDEALQREIDGSIPTALQGMYEQSIQCMKAGWKAAMRFIRQQPSDRVAFDALLVVVKEFRGLAETDVALRDCYETCARRLEDTLLFHSGWIEQPTEAGLWWWTELPDSPVEISNLTNGHGQQFGLGLKLGDVGCKLCSELPGVWSGPIVRPPLVKS